MPGSGPNPALAGVLAGFFPFGVGACTPGIPQRLGATGDLHAAGVGSQQRQRGMGTAFGLAIAGFYILPDH